MMRLIRNYLAFTLVCFITNAYAQYDVFGFTFPSNIENAHTRKIDSLDKFKPDLNAFKLLYKGDTATQMFDTTRSYVLIYSDTIKYDRSDRRLYQQRILMEDSMYQMNNNSNFYYYSKTYKYLTPVTTDTISKRKVEPSNKTYSDHFVPYMYNNKILVLQQHHGYHGYNSVGLVNFSNYVNHYFIITE